MKKRVLSALLAALLVAACLSGCGKTNDGSTAGSTSGSQSVGDSAEKESGKAENGIKVVPVSDLEYEENSELGGIEIKKYTGKDTNIEIPSVIGGKSVTRIGDKAFYELNKLESVVIPDSVTSIGERVFVNCLTSIRTIRICAISSRQMQTAGNITMLSINTLF